MNLATWAIWGAVFTIIIGVLMHYVYDYSKQNKIIAMFGSVNESVWEHLKLIFWPMVFFGIFEYFGYGKTLANFVLIRTISILIGMIIITAVFYIYSGIWGKNSFVVNIMTFITAIILSYQLSWQFLIMNNPSNLYLTIIGWILLLLIAVAFILFTFIPPKINLFCDPQNNQYGLPKRFSD